MLVLDLRNIGHHSSLGELLVVLKLGFSCNLTNERITTYAEQHARHQPSH